MDSMQDTEVLVIGGVDAHSDTHEAAVLDGRGALLGTGTFKTTFAGYAGLLDCLHAFGRGRRRGRVDQRLWRRQRDDAADKARSAARRSSRAAGPTRRPSLMTATRMC
jgi:hypothetical protein